MFFLSPRRGLQGVQQHSCGDSNCLLRMASHFEKSHSLNIANTTLHGSL